MLKGIHRQRLRLKGTSQQMKKYFLGGLNQKEISDFREEYRSVVNPQAKVNM